MKTHGHRSGARRLLAAACWGAVLLGATAALGAEPSADPPPSTPAPVVEAKAPSPFFIEMRGLYRPGFEFRKKTAWNDLDSNELTIAEAEVVLQGGVHLGRGWANEFLFSYEVAPGIFEARNMIGSITYLKDVIALDVGQMRVPFARSDLTPEWAFQVSTMPGIVQAGYQWDRGLRLRSETRFGSAWLQCFGGVFHGEGEGVDRNTDNSFLYVGRVVFGPLGKVALTESDIERSPLQLAIGAAGAWTSSNSRRIFDVDSMYRPDRRWTVDGVVKWNGLSARAEYIQGSTPASGAKLAISRYALRLQAGWVLPWVSWPLIELIGRFEQYDLDTTRDGYSPNGTGALVYQDPVLSKTRRIEAGVNVYLRERKLFLSALYRMSRFQEGLERTSASPLIGDVLGLYAQMQVP